MRGAGRRLGIFMMTALMFGAWIAIQGTAYAHCDSLDGPVVLEAIAAMEKGDVTPLLKWVGKEHEGEITAAFQKAVAVRSKEPEARQISERHFLETLVRLHRAGEGAPFSGLKASGSIDPVVTAADKAVEVGSVDGLAGKIAHTAEKGVRDRFARLMEAKEHESESVAAGREYVAAYVEYVHFVEGLHNAIARAGAHAHDEHSKEGGGGGHDH